MKFIPILFSTPMVQAILAGRKTMTRRTVKSKHVLHQMDINNTIPEYFKNSDWCPYGQTGDVLWVRESFSWDWRNYPERTEKYFYYKASTLDSFLASGEWWKPSIHMPKSACRIFLESTDVRIERLQDISEADAIAEGVIQNRDGSWHDYLEPSRLFQDSAKASFQSLWIKINGAESWQKNEWVWPVSFKRIDKPENFK